MRLALGFIFSVSASFFLVAPASALDLKFCQEYANRATAAIKKAQGAGCATEGPRWSLNGHLSWCRQVTDQETADNETQIREDRANQCSVCRDYANIVAKALQSNQQLGCGFAANVADRETWEADPEAHFRGCQAYPRDEANTAASKSTGLMIDRTNRMFGSLALCKVEKQRPAPPVIDSSMGFCRQYADRAVAAANKAKAAGCNFSDARWTSTHSGHQRWCNTSSRESVEAETEAREDRAAQCSYCREYAKLAVAAAQQNKEHKCRGTGARWSADEKGHFSWCEKTRSEYLPDSLSGATFGISSSETEAREGEIARCLHKASKTGTTQQKISVAPSGGSDKITSRSPRASKSIKSNFDAPQASLPSRKKASISASGGSDGASSSAGRNSAMDRLVPGGGSNDVRSGTTLGGRSTPRAAGGGGAARGGFSGGGMPDTSLGSGARKKSFGRSDSSVDFGIAHPSAPRPVR